MNNDHSRRKFIGGAGILSAGLVLTAARRAGDGNPEDALGVDAMLDDISLYWFTDTAASSARLYFESFQKDFGRMPLDLPVAVSIFKGEIFQPPKVWGDQTYSKLFYLERG